jgi:hypothetical protein
MHVCGVVVAAAAATGRTGGEYWRRFVDLEQQRLEANDVREAEVPPHTNAAGLRGPGVEGRGRKRRKPPLPPRPEAEGPRPLVNVVKGLCPEGDVGAVLDTFEKLLRGGEGRVPMADELR